MYSGADMPWNSSRCAPKARASCAPFVTAGSDLAVGSLTATKIRRIGRMVLSCVHVLTFDHGRALRGARFVRAVSCRDQYLDRCALYGFYSRRWLHMLRG